MFEQGINFYVLYCLCFVNDILMDIMEDQSKEEGYLDLDLEFFWGDSENNCKDVTMDNNKEKRRYIPSGGIST